MSNDIITKTFYANPIRIVTLDGEPWFVAADPANILYGRATGLTDVFARLGADEQRVVTRTDVIGLPLFEGTKAPRLRLVSESGLYKLIMRSDKPAAREFQDWVTRTVLPSIRKDGIYVKGQEKVATGEMTVDELSAALMESAAKMLKRVERERDEALTQRNTAHPHRGESPLGP